MTLDVEQTAGSNEPRRSIVFEIRERCGRIRTSPNHHISIVGALQRLAQSLHIEVRQIPQPGQKACVGRRAGHDTALTLAVQQDDENITIGGDVTADPDFDDVLPRESLDTAVRIMAGHAFFRDVHIGIRHRVAVHGRDCDDLERPHASKPGKLNSSGAPSDDRCVVNPATETILHFPANRSAAPPHPTKHPDNKGANPIKRNIVETSPKLLETLAGSTAHGLLGFRHQ